MSNRIFYDYLPGAILYLLDFNSFLTVAVVVTFLIKLAIFCMQLYKTNVLEKKLQRKKKLKQRFYNKLYWFYWKTRRSCIASKSASILRSSFGKYKCFCKNVVMIGSIPTCLSPPPFLWELPLSALWENLSRHNPLIFPNHALSTAYAYIVNTYVASS